MPSGAMVDVTASETVVVVSDTVVAELTFPVALPTVCLVVVTGGSGEGVGELGGTSLVVAVVISSLAGGHSPASVE